MLECQGSDEVKSPCSTRREPQELPNLDGHPHPHSCSTSKKDKACHTGSPYTPAGPQPDHPDQNTSTPPTSVTRTSDSESSLAPLAQQSSQSVATGSSVTDNSKSPASAPPPISSILHTGASNDGSRTTGQTRGSPATITVTKTPASDVSNSSPSNMTGIITGATIGGVILLLTISFLILLFVKWNRKRRMRARRSDSAYMERYRFYGGNTNIQRNVVEPRRSLLTDTYTSNIAFSSTDPDLSSFISSPTAMDGRAMVSSTPRRR